MNTLMKAISYSRLIKSRASLAFFHSSAAPIAPPPPLLPPAKVPVPIIEKPKAQETRQELPTRLSLIDEIIAPTFYEFRVNIKPEIVDPRKVTEIKCIPKRLKYGSIPPKNYSNSIMHIRHRKMKTHQRLKWLKRNIHQIKYFRFKRNIKKEKRFRAEIFAKVKEAEDFNAEKYVDNILSTIDKAPKSESKEEKFNKIRDLIRKYRSETEQLAPEFDDPVKPVHENVFRFK